MTNAKHTNVTFTFCLHISGTGVNCRQLLGKKCLKNVNEGIVIASFLYVSTNVEKNVKST